MAATPTKKSAAYEAGLREGRADKSKKPKVEIEISTEGEEEEGPEGEEEMDAASGKATNRKRSAKNAHHTTAPMDGGMYGKKPMDGEGCGCGGKGKAACDGTCGGAMKKDHADSALTPHEYLAACELGIQNRSRSYIRARLDAAERLDLKCGKGSISPGEKCTKGAAQKVEPKQYKGGNVAPNAKAASRLRTAGRVVGAVGALAPMIGLRSGSASGMVAGFGAARTAFTAAGALNTAAKAQATGSKVGRARLQKEAKAQALSAGSQLAGGAAGAVAMGVLARRGRRRASLERAYRAPSAKRDSVYAAGFTPDMDQLAI
jgi:hypothetical protein